MALYKNLVKGIFFLSKAREKEDHQEISPQTFRFFALEALTLIYKVLNGELFLGGQLHPSTTSVCTTNLLKAAI